MRRAAQPNCRSNGTSAPYELQWNIANVTTRSFGAGSLDVPLSGDFTGTGRTSLAVYRPSTAAVVHHDGPGYVGQLLTTMGWANVDVPVPADYYGIGKAIPAVYRPTTGEFFLQGFPVTVKPAPSVKAGDVPVPAAYDNGSNAGKAEFAGVPAGFPLDPGTSSAPKRGNDDPVRRSDRTFPVPGAYETTLPGKAEPAVFRSSTGQYFILGPTGGRALQLRRGRHSRRRATMTESA